MKSRPITADEFQRLLDVTEAVVGSAAGESWRYLLRGLWQSALRLDELMHLSWDQMGTIRPVWRENQHPILDIPAVMPWFEALLFETPPEKRKAWVSQPQSEVEARSRGPPSVP